MNANPRFKFAFRPNGQKVTYYRGYYWYPQVWVQFGKPGRKTVRWTAVSPANGGAYWPPQFN